MTRPAWHQLVMRKYEQLKAHSRSVYRSRVFPGLRLDSKAFFKNDLAKVLATLQQGIESASISAWWQSWQSASLTGTKRRQFWM